MKRWWAAVVIVVVAAACSNGAGSPRRTEGGSSETTVSGSDSVDLVGGGDVATDPDAPAGATGQVGADTPGEEEGGAAISPVQQRDGQRFEDIDRVYSALRDYFSAEQAAGAEDLSYPKTTYEALATVLVPEYLDALPRDPNRPGNYYYVVTEDGYGFGLGFWYEGSHGDSWRQSANVADGQDVDALLDAAMGAAPVWGG